MHHVGKNRYYVLLGVTMVPHSTNPRTLSTKSSTNQKEAAFFSGFMRSLEFVCVHRSTKRASGRECGECDEREREKGNGEGNISKDAVCVVCTTRVLETFDVLDNHVVEDGIVVADIEEREAAVGELLLVEFVDACDVV